MSRLSLYLASILFASSLAGGCAASSARPAVPGTIDPAADPAPTHLDRAALRAKLAQRREVTFARFIAYREARVYPVNTFGAGLRHIWIDNSGNLCAAATLISGDWGRDATVRVGLQNREIQLAHVTTGAVADWIATSGLTHHELVAIQLPGDDLNDRGMVDSTESNRLYTMYIDVERQLRSLWNENLDLAVDALLKRPSLARALLRDQVAGPGPFARPSPGSPSFPMAPPAPEPAPEPTPEPEPAPEPAVES